MKKEVMENMSELMAFMPVIALFIFLTVFIGVLMWSFRKDGKELYDKAAADCLDDGQLINKTGVK